jgi:hypothetical protein
MLAHHGQRLDLVSANELVTQALGEVGHAGEVRLAAPMHPAKQLGRPEALFSQALYVGHECGMIEIEKVHNA